MTEIKIPLPGQFTVKVYAFNVSQQVERILNLIMNYKTGCFLEAPIETRFSFTETIEVDLY